MFVDEVVIKVVAGSGGDGCCAFRREKYVEMGGPFGGNGGHGSNIVFKVDEGLHTLLDLRYQKLIKGKKGENGKGKNQHGKSAEDVIIKVPIGTVVTDIDTGFVICDLKEKNSEFIVCHGGRGGRGNTAFKTQTNTAPEFAENGEPGEEKELKVEVKMLADVGLVGLPSVGKSTFISSVSRAKPKIAAYHFTTLVPNLGVTKSRDGYSFVLADLPGLIENASIGEGLGDKFLRHIERTKVIAHVVDIAGIEGRDAYDDFILINKELEKFNPKLLKRPMIVIANKMDVDGAYDKLESFKKRLNNESIKVFPISACNRSGVEEVIDYLSKLLRELPDEDLFCEDEIESHVLYKFKKEQPYTIVKENDEFVIKGEEVEKLFKMTRFTSLEGERRFAKRLAKMGIDDELKKMGAIDGDMVRILDFYFEYKE